MPACRVQVGSPSQTVVHEDNLIKTHSFVCLKENSALHLENRNLKLEIHCMTAFVVTKQGKYSLDTSDKTSAAN